MRLVLHSALKDLRRMWRDPVALGVWLGLPSLIALTMVALFGRQEPKLQGLLLIADQDGTFVSSFLARAYTQGKLGEMITIREVKLEEGRRQIGRGEASALLIVPKGFSNAVLRNDPVKLELIANPSQTILPNMIQEVTEVLVDGAWYLHQFVGDDLRRMADITGGPPDQFVANFSVKISHLVDNYKRYIDPPAIDVASEVIQQNPVGSQNVTLLMFPGTVFMAVAFLAFGCSGDIWKEKLQGTLRRLVATPGSVVQFLAGKVLALSFAFGLVGVVALLTGRLLLGIQIHNAALAVLWVAVGGTGLYLLMLALQTSASNQRAAAVLANIVVLLLMMLGGSFFPFEMMPDFLARIGRLTPNGWALLRLRELLAGGASAASVLLSFAGAIVVASLFFALVARRLRRSFIT
jgi:ABC-2 type transport system permease protein